MKNLKSKNFKFDTELLKVAASGVSLISGIMGAVYFLTLGIPAVIAAVFGLCTILVHLQFFLKKES